MATTFEEDLVQQVRDCLNREQTVMLPRSNVRVRMDHGALLLEGEVQSVAAKKRALERAAAVPGVAGIIDRLHVAPSVQMRDGEIRAHLIDALLTESSLEPCAITARRGPELLSVRSPSPDSRGWIHLHVDDGIVTLDGDVPSLTQKRLAECLAWWIPGTRDVVNGLGVEPTERDSDDEIVDALSIVFDKDPMLKGLRIFAVCEARRVTLTGTVHTDQQRQAAENDAWALFGVDEVENQLAVAL